MNPEVYEPTGQVQESYHVDEEVRFLNKDQREFLFTQICEMVDTLNGQMKDYWVSYHREAIWVLFAYFKSGSQSNQHQFTWFPLGWYVQQNEYPEWTKFPHPEYMYNWMSEDGLGWIYQLYYVLAFHLEESTITMDYTKLDVDQEVCLI